MLIYKMRKMFTEPTTETEMTGYMGVILRTDITKAKDLFWYMDMSHNPSDSLYTFTDNLFDYFHLKIVKETDEGITLYSHSLTDPYDDTWDYDILDKNAEWLTWQQIDMWLETFGYLPDNQDMFNEHITLQNSNWLNEFTLKADAVKGENALNDKGKPLPDVSVENLKYFIEETPDPDDDIH